MTEKIDDWLEAQRINGGSHGFECIGISRMQQVWDAAQENLLLQVKLLRDALNMWLVSPQGERNSAMHETECVKSTLKALAATEPKP